MVPLLWTLLGVSLIANIVMSTQDRSSDFYLTSYRAWEFLGGSLLAWWHYGKNHDGKNHEEEAPYANMLSIAGAVLLVLSMILLKEGQPYPGWRGVFPVVGSIALIAAGKQSWINRVVLSNPVVVWIGLISYPLYLFHWPALSFVHIVKGEKPADIYLAAALVITFVLTVATYYLIEKPIRSHRSKLVVPILSIAFILTGILGLLTWQNVIQPDVPPKAKKVELAIADDDLYAGWGNRNRYGEVIVLQSGTNRSTTLYLGDSNMWQYAPRILKLVQQSPSNNRSALFVVAGGIPPIMGLENADYPQSKQLMERFQTIMESDSSIDRVVLAARWDYYFSDASKFTCNGMKLHEPSARNAALDHIGTMIRKLTDQGKEVTMVLSQPNGALFDVRKAVVRGFGGIHYVGLGNVKEKEFHGYFGDPSLRGDLAAAAQKNGATVIDPAMYLCNNGLCVLENDDGPIRYDENHLRPGFVRNRVTYLDQTLAP